MLRYTASADLSLMRLPRDELPQGRRLGSNGVLSGALHTLGYVSAPDQKQTLLFARNCKPLTSRNACGCSSYAPSQYSTDVCLGNPGRRFDLIIDTGSSITAVPCSTCKKCGPHRCGRTGCFDMGRSLSASAVDCRQPPAGFSCERCATDRCGYSVHYTEGSAIQGHVVTDEAHFTRTVSAAEPGSVMEERIRTRVFFGCQTLETGMFYKQEADGIMGLQPPRARARVPSVLTSLVQQRQATEAFSLCLADRRGLFLLGGRPDKAALAVRRTLTVPMQRNARARYTLDLRDVRVSGSGRSNGTFSSLKLPVSTYAPTLVDSGTTFVYASTPLYRAIHAHVKQHTPSLTREGGKVCAYLTPQQLGSMPSMELIFSSSSQPLVVRPQQYMVEFPKSSSVTWRSNTRHYCVAVFDNQRGGTVIGASIMRQREVIFDLVASTISFADAHCDTITPATSHLKDPYSFAPCPPGGGKQMPNRSLAEAQTGIFSRLGVRKRNGDAVRDAKHRALVRARQTASARVGDASA